MGDFQTLWSNEIFLVLILNFFFLGHKTEFGPSTNENDKNAYPDPAFLEDVARQLSRLGITTEKNVEADDEETTSVWYKQF